MMKKLLFIPLVLLFSGVASAQFRKGDWQISGSYTYDFTKSKLYDFQSDTKEKTYAYRVSAGIEYFVSNRFSIGLSPFWQERNYGFDGAFSKKMQALDGETASFVDRYDFYVRNYGFDLSASYYQPLARNLYLTFRGYGSMSFGKIITKQFYVAGSQDCFPSAQGYENYYKLSNLLWFGVTPGLMYTFGRLGVRLEFLPVSFPVYLDYKMEGLAVRTEPYYSGGQIYFSEYEPGKEFKMRKNEFGVNWGSFSLGVSYKF